MTNKMINSTQALATVGPYLHSILAGNMLYISGQLGLDPQSGKIKTTVEEQAKQVSINLGSILKEVKITYDNVVKAVMFLQHMSDFSKINEIYGNYFLEVLPARLCIEVVRLPKNDLFGIKAATVRG